MNPLSACPKCGSRELQKNGKVHGRQRYLCQSCSYNFSVPKLGKAKPIKMQRQALHLYLESMSLRGTKPWLDVSHVTMTKWVRQWGKVIQYLRKKQKPVKFEEVEIDGLYTFVARKNWLWVWVGVNRRGRKVLDFVVRGRGGSTGRRLYERLMRYRLSIYYTAPWQAYSAVLPALRHWTSKGETYTVENVNSLIPNSGV